MLVAAPERWDEACFAVPAVRAMARKLGVDLARVRASGTDGVVTMADVLP